MKTLPKTAKEEVLEALLENLRQLSSEEDWIPDHPYVIDYIQAMSEPHRVHHSWIRVAQMLREMDDLPHGIVQDPLLVQAAIFFSDVVCIPCAQHNKAKSASFCSKFYSGENKEKITQMILATERDFPFMSFDDDRDIICDLDLLPFGFERERFDLFRIEVAEEHQGYCVSEKFDDLTKDFFGKLWRQVSRGGYTYRTMFFREKYEWQARENVRRLLIDCH
jgi:predicted metal-dependent HD superfamily phosphohydrolase